MLLKPTFRKTLAPLLALSLLLGCKKSEPALVAPPPLVVDETTYVNPLLASAPDPWVYQKGGFYYFMSTTGLCLAVAVADAPAGPFTDSGRPLQCGESFINIDPMSFDDPATGKRLLYWGSGFGPIKVRELAPDRVSFVSGSPTTDLIKIIPTDAPDNYQRLVEGAWVVLRDGWYYLFYSGDNCCGDKAHYAVLVARSRSATGPFETLAEATGRPNSAILVRNEQWLAPGHNSVITDATGQDWIAYHAIDTRKRTFVAADAKQDGSRRVMLLDKLEYKDGWPQVAVDGTPSVEAVPAPATRTKPGGK